MRTYKKMNPSVKKEWVQALRSGDYLQGGSYLCYQDGNKVKWCCLGVLCDINTDSYWEKSDTAAYTVDNCRFFPDESHLDQAGLSVRSGDKLAWMNDRGKTFPEIADWIEKNL